jgi:hypothetical protein
VQAARGASNRPTTRPVAAVDRERFRRRLRGVRSFRAPRLRVNQVAAPQAALSDLADDDLEGLGRFRAFKKLKKLRRIIPKPKALLKVAALGPVALVHRGTRRQVLRPVRKIVAAPRRLMARRRPAEMPEPEAMEPMEPAAMSAAPVPPAPPATLAPPAAPVWTPPAFIARPTPPPVPAPAPMVAMEPPPMEMPAEPPAEAPTEWLDPSAPDPAGPWFDPMAITTDEPTGEEPPADGEIQADG